MMTRLALSTLMLATATSAATLKEYAFGRAMDDYEKAQIGGDRAALNRLLADDYMLVNSSGVREDKHAFIADLTDPHFKMQPYSIEHHIVRKWATGAVSAGIAHETGTSDGKPFDACIRFADTWKLVDGRWQVVFTQVARMPPPTTAGCAAQ